MIDLAQVEESICKTLERAMRDSCQSQSDIAKFQGLLMRFAVEGLRALGGDAMVISGLTAVLEHERNNKRRRRIDMAAAPTQLGLVEIGHIDLALPVADAMKVMTLLSKALICRYSRHDERTGRSIYYADGTPALQLTLIHGEQLDLSPMAPARAAHTARTTRPLLTGDAP